MSSLLPEPVPAEGGRPNPRDELLAVAVRLFAVNGYGATSIQAIAEAAGYAKSSVLYHFGSKEALLEAVLEPAAPRFEALADEVLDAIPDPKRNREFIGRFVDFLIDNSFAISIVLNQGQSLKESAAMMRATESIRKLATKLAGASVEKAQQLRFGVALGGSAYIIAAAVHWLSDADVAEPAEARDALTRLLEELLAPEHFAMPNA